jgi:hypothetical protein
LAQQHGRGQRNVQKATGQKNHILFKEENMMKSFFKKLSLVMALAMVVSLVAPAGSAFAAEAGIALQGTKTLVTEYDVEVGEEVVDFCFLGAPADWKTTYKWSSDNEAVATVNTAGKVTALKDGVANITITAGADASYKYSVKVTVGAGEVDLTAFEAAQVSDSKLTLTFADTTITKEKLAAGLSTYFYVGNVKVNYPVFKVNSVKNGVAEVESYVLFTDGTTYGFTYGDKSAEFTAAIGEVAYVTAKYACAGVDYAAYVGQNTKVTATLFNAKGIDITKSAKGYVTYALVTESTNGDYWPAGATGEFYFNTANVAAQVKATYMTGKYDEMYNPIAGPDTVISLYSTNMPKYDIDATQAPVATITTNTAAIDWSKASTVIALNDDRNSASVEKLVVKLKDNRGNDKVVTTDTANGTFTFKSTNDSVLYVAADGTIMTNKPGEVSVLVYFTLNEANAQPKVVAVVPVYVKDARDGVTLEPSKTAEVLSTAAGYNTTTFKFTVKDQLGAKIDARNFELWCNNANSLPTGAKSAPAATWAKTGTGEYTVTVSASVDNLPANANGYTYTYTVKLNWWLTKTFSVTVRKPVEANGATVVSGYKLEFAGATDIKTLGNTASATVNALQTTATLYLLSNNVKYGTESLSVKPASISDMKVGQYYYTIAKDGSLIDVNNNACVNTVGGKVVVDLTKIGTDGVVDKSKLGKGTYTIVVYKAEGTTVGATASTFYQVTSGSVTVGDTQDTMSYIGRNGDNFVPAGTTLETIVKTKFKFQIGNVTLDSASKYDANNITVTVNANTVSGGTVAYINSVTFMKQVGTNNGKPVYMKYTVNVNDYVNFK